MPSPSEVTFLIPVFNLKQDRIDNLKFILPYIKKTGCRILVVEQTDMDKSELSSHLKAFSYVEHILFKTPEKRFHKTGIINYGVFNFVNTKYVWVNDVDFYMLFEKVFQLEWNSEFIQPYEVAKKLSCMDSKIILSGKKLDVNFTDGRVKYISLYGALSFIFDLKAFIAIGGMDESIYGWGYEDVELAKRVNAKYIVQKATIKGIHLWHPTEEEKTKDMAVVTCHFNWCNYITPVRNFNRFLSQMDSDSIPLFGVELSLTGKFQTSGRPGWTQIHVTKENVCFQKEACVNLAVNQLVPDFYKKIAWVDADLFFINKNWYEDTSKKLDDYKMVQMFEHGIDTNVRGEKINSTSGLIRAGGPRTDYGYFGYPGGAIAARRELFTLGGGLYPYSFMGSGDTILMYTIYDVPMRHVKDDTSALYFEWKKKIQSYIKKHEVSYVDGNFLHEWHGDKMNRNYIDRNKIFDSVDINTNVSIDKNGIIKISGVSDGVYEDILWYFKSRKEDGVFEKNDLDKDMAIVTVFFNWAEFNTPVRNLNNFIRQMELDRLPLYGVELSLTGKFITEKYPNWIKIRVGRENVCFQKEACINLLEKYIPEKYTKIAWVDCDIFFKNNNWYQEASDKLSAYRVIQLFSKEIFLDSRGMEKDSITCLMSLGGPNAETEARRYIGTPGAALAARRDLWRIGGGLFPFSFMGGGDSVFLYSIYNNESDKNVNRASGLQKKFKPYIDWKEQLVKYVNQSCSWIDGEIIHAWHGDKNDRQYISRHEISDSINWQKTLVLDSRGVVELKNVPNSVYSEIYMYFKNRNEDGVDKQ